MSEESIFDMLEDCTVVYTANKTLLAIAIRDNYLQSKKSSSRSSSKNNQLLSTCLITCIDFYQLYLGFTIITITSLSH